MLPQLARASFVKTMISLFSLLTVVSYLSLLVCSLVTSAEGKMCVLACLGFLAWFPKETGIMQFYLYVCAHASFKRLQSLLANFNHIWQKGTTLKNVLFVQVTWKSGTRQKRQTLSLSPLSKKVQCKSSPYQTHTVIHLHRNLFCLQWVGYVVILGKCHSR